MYNYSPISQIFIRNFRNLGDIILDFNNSPIISLVGDNEAGKSSVVKAVAVLGLNAFSREQKGFIRTGTDMFGIAVKLKDGTTITRVKKEDLNRYEVKYPDGKVWSTNKIDAGLPVQVQEIMGLIEEPETKEFLHIRTYENQLLFVTTKASENYKVMYDALKVEQITKAIKLGSSEVNALRSKVNENEVSIRDNSASLKQIEVIDTSSLIEVKDRLKQQILQLKTLEKAINIKKSIDKCNKELGALRIIDTFNLKEINENEVYKMLRVSKILNSITSMKEERDRFSKIDNLEEINVNVVSNVEKAINKVTELRSLAEQSGKLLKVSNLEMINELMLNKVARAEELVRNIKDLENNKIIQALNVESIDENRITKMNKAIQTIYNIRTLEGNKAQYDNAINQLNDYMKQCHVAFEICPNCGEDVMVDLDKIKEAL